MPIPAPGRRDALRRMGLLGLSAATAAATATLWGREWVAQHNAETRTGDRVAHQLGWLKGVQFGGDFMAQERGFFERERLNVELSAGGVSTEYRALVASGAALISESNVIGMINGYLQNQPLVAFAAVLQRDPACIASLPGKPILGLKDMVGKTIGLPNSMRGQISALMRREGLDPATARFVPGGTDPSLLVSGQVDGYYDWATRIIPNFQLAGIEAHFLHMSDIGAPGYGELLFARRDMLEQHFDLFVRYTRALVGGWQWMVDHPDETAQIVGTRYASPGLDLRQQTLEARQMRDYITSGDAATRGLLWIDAAPFEKAVQLGYDAGDIPRDRKIDVSKMVTSAVVKAAHRAIGG